MGWWERKTHLPSSHYLRCFFSRSESSLQDHSRKPGVPLQSPLTPGMLPLLFPDPVCHRSISGTSHSTSLNWYLGNPLQAWPKFWTNECYFVPFFIIIYLQSKNRGSVFMWMPQLLASSSARNEYLNICTVTSLSAGDVLQKCSTFCFSISKELRQSNNKTSPNLGESSH